MLYPIILAVLAGYFLGNLNGAVTMSIFAGREDIRKKGSGNAGLTNFFRNYGGWDTLLVFVIDAGKAVLGALLGKALLAPYGFAQQGAMLAGFAVILGHNFPALLGFRGGKGIICSAAVAAVVDWRIFVTIILLFLLFYGVSKYVSLGSCAGAVGYAAAACVLYWKNLTMMLLGIAIGCLALFMHRENIVRLAKGTENKTYLRKRKG